MDFVIGLLLLIDWKRNSYDAILIIVNWLTKTIYYESVKILIDAAGLAEIGINMVVKHHSLPELILGD